MNVSAYLYMDHRAFWNASRRKTSGRNCFLVVIRTVAKNFVNGILWVEVTVGCVFCQGRKPSTDFSKKSEILLVGGLPGPGAGAFEARTEAGTLRLTRHVSSGWVPSVKAIPLWNTGSCARGLSPVILSPIWAHLLREPSGSSHGERGIAQWQRQGITRLSAARRVRAAFLDMCWKQALNPETSTPSLSITPWVLCFATPEACLEFSGFCGGVSWSLGTDLG